MRPEEMTTADHLFYIRVRLKELQEARAEVSTKIRGLQCRDEQLLSQIKELCRKLEELA